MIANLISTEELLSIRQKLDEEERRVRRLMDVGGYLSTFPDFSLWLLGLAADDPNDLRGRYYNLAQRARAVLQNSEDEKRRQLLDDIVGQWEAISN